ncbi:UrcA family protein [Sphingomonas asaccharolytica]|uniref:UrcA family protein n=1 Tax=Sphingomonas asaccharolytica TaxID=40681 RepID=UPI00082F9625|nr:UrcA family protein [Sphingomonas asaccharolytica]
MRFTFYAVAILLGACVDRPALSSEPRLSVRVADVVTDTPSGRAELRQRVVDATQRFCTVHGAEITPYESREDPSYCPDMARSWAMSGMTRDMRRAYALARREAKVRGSAP